MCGSNECDNSSAPPNGCTRGENAEQCIANTVNPTTDPTINPSTTPTKAPTSEPTNTPSKSPSKPPTLRPTQADLVCGAHREGFISPPFTTVYFPLVIDNNFYTQIIISTCAMDDIGYNNTLRLLDEQGICIYIMCTIYI